MINIEEKEINHKKQNIFIIKGFRTLFNKQLFNFYLLEIKIKLKFKQKLLLVRQIRRTITRRKRQF